MDPIPWRQLQELQAADGATIRSALGTKCVLVLRSEAPGGIHGVQKLLQLSHKVWGSLSITPLKNACIPEDSNPKGMSGPWL